jgi:hypothetical protein
MTYERLLPAVQAGGLRHIGRLSIWNGGMCEKCVEIDDRIKRYRNILRTIDDGATVDESN